MKGLANALNKFNDLIVRINKLEDIKAVNDSIITSLQDENSRLNDLVNKLDVRTDDLEQRSRNTCLLLHGVVEAEGENTDDIILKVINEDLGLMNITIDDIQRSHRLGPKREATRNTRSSRVFPRPIIFKFVNFRKRTMVFKEKKKLKNKDVSLSENLTKKRYLLLKESIVRLGKGNAWSQEGRIVGKVDNKLFTINSVNDLP